MKKISFKDVSNIVKAFFADVKILFGRIKSLLRTLPAKIKESRLANVDFHELVEKMQQNSGLMIFTFISAFLVMLLVSLAVFFINVKGPEKVMVPDVTGKKLTTALLEMQVKELYPKIQLRYSEIPGDEGVILDQTPAAGSIVKGYTRVSLIVSRGVIIDHVENYVGEKIDDVRLKLQTIFAGSAKPFIIIDDPEYKTDQSAAGTILEQDPPKGTSITDPVTVHFVVSRGPNYEMVHIPNLVGSTVNDVLQQMARNKLVFDFTSHVAAGNEQPGTVVKQQTFDSDTARAYTRMPVEFALPSGSVSNNMYGIFTDQLSDYPYPVPMKLTAYPPEGDPYIIVNFNHPGGSCSIPYAVPKDTVLVLSVIGKEHKKMTVR
jgi:eukaryotic-like serine/threonine-protein kinase